MKIFFGVDFFTEIIIIITDSFKKYDKSNKLPGR